MLYLKNYFKIFVGILITIIISKFIFTFYLIDSFKEYTLLILIKSIFLGYKFDIAISSIIALLVTFLDFNKKALTLIFAFSISSVWLSQISDIMYFYESSRHMGYEISDALTDASGLLMTALSQHSLLSTLSILLSILLFIFIVKFYKTGLKKVEINKLYIIKKLVLILITVFFARGMFQNIPLNPWQANQIGDPKLAAISLNGTYNALYALLNKSKKLKPINLILPNEININENIKSLYSKNQKVFKNTLNKPNIVILFMESWSASTLNSYGYSIKTTPFFDDILKKSIRPKAMIAGGHRTTEGIFSTLASYQNPLGKTIAKTQLQDFKYTSFIDILNKDGYNSLFFQGSSKETSGTGSFVQSLGFKESFGKKDIKNRIYEENYWGVHDPDLYNFALDKISKIKKPFIIGLNGATTHDNKIPASINPVQFTSNIELNKQLNALHFSDKALKDFFKKTLHLYPNTLFVILADHCGGVKGSTLDNYMIPFAIYHQNLKAKYYDQYISQRDITPTLLDILYGNYKNITNNLTGKSLVTDNNFFADYYHNGYLGWIEDKKSIEINLSNNKYKCFDLSSFNEKEMKCNENSTAIRNKALSFTKISQKLLFEGKTKNFKEYINE